MVVVLLQLSFHLGDSVMIMINITAGGCGDVAVVAVISSG